MLLYMTKLGDGAVSTSKMRVAIGVMPTYINPGNPDASAIYFYLQVMVLDATLNSRPIVQTVETPDQITEIFDSISYSKGASVLRLGTKDEYMIITKCALLGRMLENFMGADRFRSGISHFLQRFKYGNAKTNDLWQDLNDVAQGGINVTNIMDTWTRQMGFPLVTVSLNLAVTGSYRCISDLFPQVRRIKPNTYRVTQSRYLLDPSLADESASSPYNYRWEIPLTWITDRDSNNAKLEWLGRDQSHLDIDVPSGVFPIGCAMRNATFFSARSNENPASPFFVFQISAGSSSTLLISAITE